MLTKYTYKSFHRKGGASILSLRSHVFQYKLAAYTYKIAKSY